MFRDVFRNAFKAKDRRPIWEWASQFVTLFPPLTQTGKFDCSRSKHFLRPLEWFRDDSVRELNILAPVRSAKTLIGDVCLDWTVVNDPGPFRVVMQDDQTAREHAESRTMRQLKAIPGVEFLLPTDRHKERGQEIILPTGHNLYIQGPALNKVQSKGFRYVWVDEPWLQTVSKNFGEIKGRLGDYERMKISKLLCTGQGGGPGDVWDEQCKSGEWNEWHVTCPKCGHYMPGEFHAERPDGSHWGIVWDEIKDANEMFDVDACVKTVRFECQKCGHHQFDSGATKAEWNETGKYIVAGKERPDKKTAHWTFVIDYPWSLAVEQWLRACNVFRATRETTGKVVFYQKRLARSADERTVQGSDVMFRREKYDPSEKVAGEVGRLMSIDCQSESLFWVMVRSWIVDGPKVETRLVWFGKLFSFEEIDAKAKELNLTHKPLIDSGFKAKGVRGVYAAAIKFGWIATKGVGGITSFVHIEKGRRVQRSYAPRTYGDSETPAGNCVLFRFSSPAMSDLVQGMIDAGAWIEPEFDRTNEMHVALERHMKSEAMVPVRNRWGQVEMKWRTIDDENHGWDCAKQQCFGAVLGKIMPDPFSKESEQTNEKE